MFYTSHPVTDILKASSIFKALNMYNEEHVHGSPYDRGGADAYYGRSYAPHKCEKIYPGRKTGLNTKEEIEQYEAAYFHSPHNRHPLGFEIHQEIYNKYGYLVRVCIMRKHPRLNDNSYDEYEKDLKE